MLSHAYPISSTFHFTFFIQFSRYKTFDFVEVYTSAKPKFSVFPEMFGADSVFMFPCRLIRVLPPVQLVVGSSGLEPPTSRLSGVRSNHLSYEPMLWPLPLVLCLSPAYLFPGFAAGGGDEQNRTVDPLLARQVLSQLSYTPIFTGSFLSRVSCFFHLCEGSLFPLSPKRRGLQN